MCVCVGGWGGKRVKQLPFHSVHLYSHMAGSSVIVEPVHLVATVFSPATKPTLRQSAARTVLNCKTNRIRTLPRTNTQTFPSNKTKIRRHHNEITNIPTPLKSHDLQCMIYIYQFVFFQANQKTTLPNCYRETDCQDLYFYQTRFLLDIRVQVFTDSVYTCIFLFRILYTFFAINFHSTFKTFVSVLIKHLFFCSKNKTPST